MNMRVKTIIFLVLVITAASLTGCDIAENETEISYTNDFSNLTEETKDKLILVYGYEEAEIFLQHIEWYEQMGLTIRLESQGFSRHDDDGILQEFFNHDIVIDILPDVPFGLTDIDALETFFDFGVFVNGQLQTPFPFHAPSSHRPVALSEALINEIMSRDGLAELYFEVGNRIHIENFWPELTWTLNEYSNYNQETISFLLELFDEPAIGGTPNNLTSTFMRFLRIFETELGLTIKVNHVTIDGELYEIYIDILPNVPFGLTNVDAMETFFDFRAFANRDAGFITGFLTFYGLSEELQDEIRQRNGLYELFHEVARRKDVEHFFPERAFTLNEYSNFNDTTMSFLLERFDEPGILHLLPGQQDERLASIFMRYLAYFETELGLTIKFNQVIIDDVLYEVYIDTLPNVPFGLTGADAIEVFLDFRALVIYDTDIQPDIHFASFDGISKAVVNEIKQRDGLHELFMEILEQRQ